MFNIIDEPVFRVLSTDGAECLGIAEILHRFRRDDILTFTAMRPHQAGPFHMFLAQLAATAAYRWGSMPETAADWAEAIFGLTFGDRDPWEAIQPDASKPGFMQFPMPKQYEKTYGSPDELDIIYQSRHHSHKIGSTRHGLLDDWLMAIITTQTTDRYAGKMVHGVVRTGSGYGIRPFCGLAPKGNMGAHILRDVDIMVANFESLAETYGYDIDGLDILWLEAWDGNESLGIDALAPYFIEACRPFRLAQTDYGFMVWRATTEVARIEAKERNGVLGDHWMPINLGVAKSGDALEPKAFSVGQAGWTADVLTRILFGRNGQRHFKLPASFTQKKGDTGLIAVFRGMARDQGKFLGFFEREIPMRTQMLTLLGSENGRDQIAEVSNEMLREISLILGGCKNAIWAISSGGDPEKFRPDYQDGAFTNTLNQIIPVVSRQLDECFFEDLQDRLEDPSIRVQQIAKNVKLARKMVLRLIESRPLTSALRQRILCAAEYGYETIVFAKKEMFSPMWQDIKAAERAIETVNEDVYA